MTGKQTGITKQLTAAEYQRQWKEKNPTKTEKHREEKRLKAEIERQNRVNSKTFGILAEMDREQYAHLLRITNLSGHNSLSDLLKILEKEQTKDQKHLDRLYSLPIFPNEFEKSTPLIKFYKIQTLIYRRQAELSKKIMVQTLKEYTRFLTTQKNKSKITKLREIILD